MIPKTKTCVLSIRADHTDLATVARILKEEHGFETNSLGSLGSHCIFFLAHILSNKYGKEFTTTELAIEYLKERGLKDQKVSRKRGRALLNRLNDESFEISDEIVKGIGIDDELKGV